MKMSKDLAVQLHILQKSLSVPKTRINKFAGYNYRNCEDILEAVKEMLPNGCFVSVSDEIVMIGDRFYVKATACFSDGESEIKSYALAREPLEKKGSDSMQITGAASSYARKYALNGLFSIDDSVDADSHDNREEPKKTSTPSPAKPSFAKPAPAQQPKQEAKQKQDVEPSKLNEVVLQDFANALIMQHGEDDKLSASEMWSGLNPSDKAAVWAKTPKNVQDWLKALMQNAPKGQKYNKTDYAGV